MLALAWTEEEVGLWRSDGQPDWLYLPWVPDLDCIGHSAPDEVCVECLTIDSGPLANLIPKDAGRGIEYLASLKGALESPMWRGRVDQYPRALSERWATSTQLDRLRASEDRVSVGGADAHEDAGYHSSPPVRLSISNSLFAMGVMLCGMT